MALPLLPTSLVGSQAQPDWLIDRDKLAARFPPRTRAQELWRVAPEFLEQAWDDATILAIREQEDAGLDIVTDGEARRESYSNRFATALDGVDIDNHGTALDRSGEPVPVPRVVGPISRKHPIQVRDVEFLVAHTDRTTKITVPGPFTMAQQAQGVVVHALAEILAREELLLRLGWQVRDADDVAHDEHVHQVLEHAHEVGVEAGKVLLVLLAAEKRQHLRMVRREEFGPRHGTGVQAVDVAVGVEQGVGHGTGGCVSPVYRHRARLS